LKPSKVRDLIPSFAMEIGESVDVVTSVIGFYYKKVRLHLGNLKSSSIQIENLGSFYIKERALDNNINKYENLIKQSSNNTITEYAAKVSNKEKLEMMKTVKEKLNIEKERRKEVINKRFK